LFYFEFKHQFLTSFETNIFWKELEVSDTSKGIAIEIRGNSEDDFTHHFDDFKKEHGIHFVLAFSGGADDNSPQIEHVVRTLTSNNRENLDEKALKDMIDNAKDGYVAEIVKNILSQFKDHKFAVLTGGTNWGVPRVATKIARDLGIKTIGVFPLTGMDDALTDELDFSVCVHPMLKESEWGDESPAFTKLLDAVVVIGGGAGTMVEVSHLLKLNERNLKKKRPVKHIIPVLGTGGTADKLSFFPGKPAVMASCIPAKPFVTGAQVREYLISDVFPSDVYDPLD
jgi:predicted Rossmann-fold nucleotide-binding protein